MKNLLKISLACLCLLISVNVLKSQNCDVSKSDISMEVLGQELFDDYIYTTVKVSIKNNKMVGRISVGNNMCYTISQPP